MVVGRLGCECGAAVLCALHILIHATGCSEHAMEHAKLVLSLRRYIVVVDDGAAAESDTRLPSHQSPPPRDVCSLTFQLIITNFTFDTPAPTSTSTFAFTFAVAVVVV